MLALGVSSCRTVPSTETGELRKTVSLDKITTGKKILVVYFTRTGNTERVAKDIAAALDADIERIREKDDRSGCLGYFAAGRDGMNEKSTEIEPVKSRASDYDIVIIGSPVWAWNLTPAVRTYIEQNRGSFKAVSFFITAGSTNVDEVLTNFENATGKKAVSSLGVLEDELGQPEVYMKKVGGFNASFKKK